MVGVILAAGAGTRMARLPTQLPKTILPVLGEPLIYHQLRTMAGLGIGKAFIVVGHLGFRVVREIERLPHLGISVEYVEQEQMLGIAHCVSCLEPHIDGPFLLLLGDIYFHAPRIGELLELFVESGADAVLGAVEEANVEAIRRNFCIVTDSSGLAVRVIEKPRHPKSNLKGVGLYLFQPVVFDAIRRTPRTAMRNEYEITDSIQILIDDGYKVRPCTCIDADLNITYPRDLLDINLRLLRNQGLRRLVCDGARVAADARVEMSVIGPGAVVEGNAHVARSIVFAGARVEAGVRLKDAIVTEQGVYPVT